MNKEELIAFENQIADRFNNGELPYLVHFSGGNEDQLIDIFKDIKPGDWIFSTHRSHYHYLLAGGPPKRLEKLIMDGRSMFVFDKSLNFYSSSIVCATPSIAAGVAWALKKRGSNQKVWCFLGDGAEDEGHLYEAARYVDGWNLPCTFIIEDNDRSVSAGKAERWGTDEDAYCKRISRTAVMPVFDCVKKYHYRATYPHSGSKNAGWLQFKKEAVPEKVKKVRFEFPDQLRDPLEMSYKDAVQKSMEMLAKNDNTIFIGYNVRYGSAYGSLNNISNDQRLETPLAENLMAGLAIGMSFIKFRPVLFFERHDFIFNALDAIVNQIDKVETLSQGQFNAPVIIKAVAGSIKPFYAGMTHTSNLFRALKGFLNFSVCEPMTSAEVIYAYQFAMQNNAPILISERKELY